MKRSMKQGLCRAIARVAPGRSTGVRVLLYHAIDDPDPADRMSLRVSRQQFLEQMTVLRDEGYAVAPLGTLLRPPDDGRRARVAITFDDGYRSQEWAAALLQEFGFPATFFVVPRFLDGVQSPKTYWEAWGHLRWDGVAALMDRGFDIGAHSTTHPDLRKCADAALEGEVSGARALLERRLGRAVVHFSYPHGRHDRRVRRAVERAGYQIACTSRYGLNRTSGSSYAVRRTEVTGADSLRDFRSKLHGKYDWLGYWQDVRPTP
jgi:peptidoglycan/xylan/chitin deacetylase (PgdA/CDA1 family)